MNDTADTVRQAAFNSRVAKYIKFAIANHEEEPGLIPILPLQLKHLCLFCVFCSSPEGGVRAGWSSVANYTSAIVSFALKHGSGDPREASDLARYKWKSFRHNFIKNIKVVRTHKRKLAIQPALLAALILSTNVKTKQGLLEATMWATLWYSSVRAGHVSIKHERSRAQIIQWNDICFEPNRQQATRVLIRFRASKTRPEAQGEEFSSVLSKCPPDGKYPWTCPVKLLQEWYTTSYNNVPSAPVFCTAHDQKPITRAEFTRSLRATLPEALQLLKAPFKDLSPLHFSGISFRKGSLTAYAAILDAEKVQAMADHKSSASTRYYIGPTTQQRAENHALIHKRRREL